MAEAVEKVGSRGVLLCALSLIVVFPFWKGLGMSLYGHAGHGLAVRSGGGQMVFCEPSEVLNRGGQQELVARATQSAQSQPCQAQVAFQIFCSPPSCEY